MIDFNTRPEWLRRMLNEVKESYYVPDNVGPIAFDFGMNVGAFSLLNAHKFEKIFAFEPSYDSYHKAASTLKAFGIDNVYAYNLAVWAESGEILNLRQNPKHTASGNAYIGQKDNSEQVLSISLDHVFEIAGVDKVDYVKMDVEGSEEAILLYNDLNRIHHLCMEMHYGPYSDKFNAIQKKLINSGFKFNKKHSNGNIQYWINDNENH